MPKEIARKIRSICNHPWKRELLFQNKIMWTKLWISLDLIDDTQNAIDNYSELDDFSSSNGYLYIFGVLQAMFVQLDAVNSLKLAINEDEIDFKKDFPKLYQIVELRNNSIGHPTNRRNDKSFHLIVRSSISKNGFTMVSYQPKADQSSFSEEINLPKIIEKQADLLRKILDETMQNLTDQYEKHKIKFSGSLLKDEIHSSFDYLLTKLYEFESPIYKVNLDYVSETHEKLKNGISARYSSLEALHGTNILTAKIDYIISRIRRDVVENLIEDEIELGIIVESLTLCFVELKTIVNEIDNEFS